MRKRVDLGQRVTAWLLSPLPRARVAYLERSGKKFAHVEGHVIKAALTHAFGFGMWSDQVLSCDLVYEEQNEKGRWVASYRSMVRLTCWDQNGTVLGPWDDGCVETSAPQASRGEAHDLAYKSALTGGLKRAASKGLGNQFGLSLYMGSKRNGDPHDVIINAVLSGMPEDPEQEEQGAA